MISDRIENVTAAQLARCNMIAVCPFGGWFKNYKDNKDLDLKYSFVVSLETPEQKIFDEIANKVVIVLPLILM